MRLKYFYGNALHVFTAHVCVLGGWCRTGPEILAAVLRPRDSAALWLQAGIDRGLPTRGFSKRGKTTGISQCDKWPHDLTPEYISKCSHVEY